MNYNIENGLNFYETLKQTMASHESEKNEQEGICPISNTPLEARFFTFECGHKFNYEPLFKDIYNHKTKYNNLEHTKERLAANEIRCPFCRKKQTGILPYYSELSFSKVHGVNYINPDIIEYARIGGVLMKCQFNIPSEANDGTTTKCQSIANVISSEFCLCYPHYKQHKLLEKQKLKAIKDAQKLAQKTAEKEAKVAQKNAEKEAKVAAKQAAKSAKK